MLKKRIIGCVNIKNGICVQSINFRKYLPIGRPEVTVEFLNRWGIDEISIIDMDSDAAVRGPNFLLISKLSQKNLTPLAVGGGIRSLEQMKKLNRLGAEKIIINTLAIEKPELITAAANIFGAQFVTISIDVKKTKAGKYEVYRSGGKIPTGIDPIKLAEQVVRLGAGELFINSIDRDGSKKGFDCEIINKLVKKVNVPVIACGGAGQALDFFEVFDTTNVSAAAAGNFFNFTEHSPITLKSFLLKKGVKIRLDTYADYEDTKFDNKGRIAKKSDEYLSELRFKYIADEVI